MPPVFAPCAFESLVTALQQRAIAGPGLMLVEPAATTEAVPLADVDAPTLREVTLVIGPEGGWTPQEITRAEGTCRLVRLGSRTLRADAMPLVALAALLTICRDL